MEKERINMLEDRIHYLERLISNYDEALTQIYILLIIQGIGVAILIGELLL